MAGSLAHKVIWSEGLLVSPQHFQQADRYHQHALDARVRSLAPYGWGTICLEIDDAALDRSGIFVLHAYRGILPSGATISIPDGDRAPAGREVPPRAFPPGSDRLGVYLAVPLDRPQARNYDLSSRALNQGGSRYSAEPVRVVDECSGENEQEIIVARKNLRILFEGEPSDGCERLKIAELRRSKEGRVTLSRDYIPPCLVLSASPHLLRMLQALITELTATSEALLSVQQQRSLDRYEFRGADVDLLWLLGAVHAALPLLAHYSQTGQVHPEVLYRSLLQLAGQLTVLSVQVRATDLPAYDHDDLSTCIWQLDQRIRTLLHIALGQTAVQVKSIRLQEASSAAGYPVLCTPGIMEEPLFTTAARFYLLVRAVTVDASHQDALNQRLAHTATIAAFAEIDNYIEHAYGVGVVPTYPPEGVLPRSGAAYFALRAEGAAWDSIQLSRTLALYVPRSFRAEFTQFEVELLIVQGDGAAAAQQPSTAMAPGEGEQSTAEGRAA